ncbi:sigma 54-interacting transcriptional regulator [Mucilaginibacter sp. BJC16-A38]|uniref:sigma 54-interacting response regulator n=1 Tax=Mucilaginibacter phenanthrenivorans TaxID=1234842 RepID=UPI002158225D|nr:sigma 54-interacting response regulator [Mucilaginibacter phenanthrenivorans]MCR8560338.1 sigma 54-interacting transcriptional regulator [Mucilaginibacter phenanthrenivorans]
MGSKILIVEDQFVEANDLKIILERAGHEVTGIAKSYDHACVILGRVRPDIVLLDIYLKGKLTGIDLATLLSSENIPFIYLSANSNESVLEAAKVTRPWGFLVKPFRAKDVLVALDIAEYRHNNQVEIFHKQENLLTNILGGLLLDQSNVQTKLLKVAQAFKPYVPFDFLFIDVDMDSGDLDSLVCLKRTSFDEYVTSSGYQIIEEMGLNYDFYLDWRRRNSTLQNILLQNLEQMVESCKTDPFLTIMKDQSGAQARIIVPCSTEAGIRMSVRFYSKEPHIYTVEHLDLLNPLRTLLCLVIDNIRRQSVKGALEYGKPKTGVTSRVPQPEGIVGNSPKLLRALDQATQVANFDMTVLVLGETGVGKEGLVKAIHQMSNRNRKPLIKVNCAAIPALLIESELFGHEKGSFTGAYDRRIGKFEQAQGGTIFLDEIGEIPLDIQTKLLRVLQEKELERIGGRTTIKIDVRVIVATNRDLHRDIADGRFRMDLFYRINVFPILMPPLRDRKEDIPLLTDYFLHQHAADSGTEVKRLAPNILQQLTNYSWPGNIRELLHVIERNVVLSPTNIISRIELPDDVLPAEPNDELSNDTFRTIEEVDRDHIILALRKCNGRVSGKGGAAEILNIPATTLNSKMKKLGISWKFLY